jgi:ketosteroid isomerase-like protein
MSRPAVLSLALFATLLSTPTLAACPAGSADDIRAAYTRWLAVDDAHDLDGTMAIFDHDVVFQFQGAPDGGWDALKASYKTEFASASDGKWSPSFDRIEVSGDLAAAFATWTYTKAGKATQHNVSADIFRRNAACEWHIVRSLNYPKK